MLFIALDRFSHFSLDNLSKQTDFAIHEFVLRSLAFVWHVDGQGRAWKGSLIFTVNKGVVYSTRFFCMAKEPERIQHLYQLIMRILIGLAICGYRS